MGKKKKKSALERGLLSAERYLQLVSRVSFQHKQTPLFHRKVFRGFPIGGWGESEGWAFDSAKNHKRQRRKRQSVTAKREKSQTPEFV